MKSILFNMISGLEFASSLLGPQQIINQKFNNNFSNVGERSILLSENFASAGFLFNKNESKMKKNILFMKLLELFEETNEIDLNSISNNYFSNDYVSNSMKLFFNHIKEIKKDKKIEVWDAATQKRISVSEKYLSTHIFVTLFMEKPFFEGTVEELINIKNDFLSNAKNAFSIEELQKRALDLKLKEEQNSNLVEKPKNNIRYFIVRSNIDVDKLILSFFLENIEKVNFNENISFPSNYFRDYVFKWLQNNTSILNTFADRLNFWTSKKYSPIFEKEFSFLNNAFSITDYVENRTENQSPILFKKLKEKIEQNSKITNENLEITNENETISIKSKEIEEKLNFINEINNLELYSKFLESYKNHLQSFRVMSATLTAIAWSMAAGYAGASFFSFGGFGAHFIGSTIQASIMTYFTNETFNTYNEISELEKNIKEILENKELAEFKKASKEIIDNLKNLNVLQQNAGAYIISLPEGLLISRLLFEQISKQISKISLKIWTKAINKAIEMGIITFQSKIFNNIAKFTTSITAKKTALLATSWINPISWFIPILDLSLNVYDLIKTKNFQDAIDWLNRK